MVLGDGEPLVGSTQWNTTNSLHHEDMPCYGFLGIDHDVVNDMV